MIAWVLGASGAWGRATTVELIGRSFDVAHLGRRDLRDLADFARDSGREWTFIPFDLAAPSLAGLPATAPDLLVCAASLTGTDRQRLVEANYLAVTALVEHVLAGMHARGSGRIGVFLGQNARLGLRGVGPYSASQAALWTWLEAAQDELSRRGGVTITRVIPSRTGSPTQRFVGEKSGHQGRTRRPVAGPIVDGILAGRRTTGRRPWLAALATAFR